MKKWITIFLFYAGNSALFSQTQPVVELFFKDANGLRDTIWIGIDPFACDSLLNPSLGELRIDENIANDLKFKIIGTKIKQDSIKDAHIFKAIFSKRNIFYRSSEILGLPEFVECGSLHRVVVLKCRIINFPLNITWNKFDRPEKDGHSFTLNPLFFSDKEGAKILANGSRNIGLAFKDSILIQKTDLTKWPNTENDYLLLFSVNHAIVGTKDLNTKNLSTLQIFPNPSANTIRLDTGEPINGGRIQFYSATGALLKTQTVQQTEINISDLPRGMIIGVLSKEGLPSSVFRFVKVE